MRTLLIGLVFSSAALAAQPGKNAVPLFFIENHGQAPPGVRFMAKGSGITAYFSPAEVLYRAGGKSVRIEFPGARQATPIGTEELPGRANFFRGPAEAWLTDVPLFRGVAYRDLYPGIDLLYGCDGANLKSLFQVSPGADPSAILMRYDTVDLRISGSGELLIPLNGQQLHEAVPTIYQENAGARVPVEGRFVLAGAGTVRLEIARYDRSQPLVIDPTLSYSTLLGGSAVNAATALAVDANGDAYITGYTSSYNFPTVSPEQNVNAGGNEVFVAKMNPIGTVLVYCTYIGGAGDDRGLAIAVDSTGAAYVTGSTTSQNFPARYPLQPTLLGGKNAFVLKLSPAGNALTFATYLGGSGSDAGNGIALDPSANVYVVGDTTSLNFPTTVLQKSNAGGQDAFVASLTTNGTQLRYSTYLGGSGTDHGAAIAVDSTGSASVTGGTYSTNFPLANALQKTIGGSQNAFVARFAPGGASLTFSTYLGGGGGGLGTPEEGQGIALDSQGNLYVGGVTSSGNFPLLNALSTTLNGSSDAFVAKFTTAGTLVYSTYLGGSGIDVGNAITVDSTGRATVVGYTASTDFPIQAGFQTSNAGGYDAFVAEFSATGNALVWSSYLGGSGSDSATGAVLDPVGNLYVAGYTLSTNFPLADPYQTVNTDNYTAFVAKIAFPTAVPAVLGVTPSSGSGTAQTFSLQFSDVSGASDITSVSVLFNTSTSVAGACSVTYSSSQNTLALLTDAGASPATAITPGNGSQQNSQCILNGAASTVTLSGTTLTLNLSLSFQSAFSGSKTVYLEAANPVGSTGWESKGAWTALPNTLSAVSVTPASGSGLSQSFALQFSDSAGASDITGASVLFNTSTSTTSTCSVTYVRAQNTLALLTDAGASPGTTITPGGGSQQNSQCILNGAASSVAASGNLLTLTLALTFQPAFQGAKTVYLQAANPAGTTAWQAAGTWTVPFTAAVASVSPASGAAPSQTFVFQFSDTGGATDLSTVAFLIGVSAWQVNACSVTYARAQNTLALLTDAGALPATAITPGSGSQQNSQCILSGAGSGVSASGNVLTLTVSLTFQPAFAGAKIVYMLAANPWNSTGWQATGTWTTRYAVSPVSVTPASGSGSSQTFAFQFSDSGGASDLTNVWVLINGSLSASSACMMSYTRAQNTLALLTDIGASPGTTITPGSGSQQNSQCTLNGAGSSVSLSGNVLTLFLSLTFQAPFAGAKTVYLQAANVAGTSAWQAEGTWTVQFVPSVVSLSPASGSGSLQTFGLQFSDTGGAANLTSAAVLFNTTNSTASACSVTYTRAQNTLALLTDAGASPGSTITPGSGSQQNSQCILNGAGSSVSLSGNVLTLSLSLTFQASFQGPKIVYLQAADPSASTGWQPEGSWTGRFGTVSPVSVSPSSGSGSSQSFAIQVSDTGGAADLSNVWVLVNSGLSASAGCMVGYSRTQNTLTLLADGGWSTGNTITPGSGLQQNSQCILVGAGSSATASGNVLILTLSITFLPAFTGAKTVYVQGSNSVGSSAWQAEGTWTVQFSAGVVSVSPPSGSGSSQTFTFQFTDSAGAANLTSTSVLLSTINSTAGACSVTYTSAQNSLALLTDAGTLPGNTITPGSGSQQNSQCILYGAGSSVSLSGNGFTLNLSLAFLGGFQGLKTVYLQALDSSGSTGWQARGSWTVQFGSMSVVSVSPSSGSAWSQSFAFQFSDTGGAADLTNASVLFNTGLSASSACMVDYNHAQNTLTLLADGGWSTGNSITPGGGSQQNSQCILNGAASNVSASGNVLTLTLSLTFLPAFAGPKTVYAQAANGAGTTPWHAAGTWTP